MGKVTYPSAAKGKGVFFFGAVLSPIQSKKEGK
jgi:hypothetical protein